jgi:hypothetical protein
MRLSNEAKNYVESLYSQKMDEVSKNLQNDLGHIRASFDKSPTSVKYQKLNQVSAEKFRELMMTRARAYIKAYELDGRLLDEAEVREITAELTQIADVQIGHALVAIGYESQFLGPPAGLSEQFQEDLKRQYKEAVGEAISELRRAMTYTALIEKGKIRYQTLLEIYELTKDDRQSPINFNRLRPVADPNRHELDEAIAYLRDEGLVEQNGMFVSITPKGVREVEQSISNPQRPTEHFQPAVIQYFQAPIYGGVQTGGQGNVQNISIRMESPLEATLSACSDLLRIADIPILEKEDISEALLRLDQLAQKEKSPDVIVRAKERLDKVRAIFETDKNIARPAAQLLNVLYDHFTQCESHGSSQKAE